MLIYNFGVLLAFLLGNYFDYFMTPKVMIGFLIVFVSLFIFFPESPMVLVKQNKIMVSDANHSFQIRSNSFVAFFDSKPKNQ